MSLVFFKIVFVALWIIYFLIRAPYDNGYKREDKMKTIHSAKKKYLLFLLSFSLLLIPLVWLFTPFLDSFELDLPVWARLFGIVLVILSLFYFKWIYKTLGANWSPTLEVRKGNQLIKSGPYKRIRHPMYVQIWLWTIAQFLIISNILAGLSEILAWMILYFIRVPKEEKMMLENFGDEYIQYMKQTGSVFPGFGLIYKLKDNNK